MKDQLIELSKINILKYVLYSLQIHQEVF